MVIKLLAFTDPHGDLGAAKSILALARREKPDAVLCGGDFSYFGTQHEDFLKCLADLGQPVWFVSGNHETLGFSREVETRHSFMRDVSYRTVEVDGIRVAGVPGTNEFWPGQAEEDEAYDTAVQLCDLKDRAKPLVFITHFPPRGSAVDGRSHPTPDSGGSRVVRRIVEAIRPTLVICGHYHQDFGKTDTLGATRIVNPGPHGQMLEVRI